MNVFDLPGPEFLVVWCVGAAVVAVTTLALRALLSKPHGGDVDAIARSLEPDEVAYLEGDRERVIESAVAGLVHRGVLEVHGARVELATGTDDELVTKSIRADGVYRGVVDDVAPSERASDAEAYVIEAVRDGATSVGSLFSGAGQVESRLRARLELGGMLVDRTRRARWFLRAPALAWLGIGAAKIMIGIARDRPVALLAILLVAGAFALSIVRLPRLTWLGKRVLANVRDRSYGLEATARSAPALVSGHDVALAYALFGGAVLGATYAAVMPSVHREALLATTTSTYDPSTTNSMSTCGSSSGGRSCSSGGGGGCGGGGGGCGGGGCGGCGS